MKSIVQAVYRWHPKPPFFYGWVVLGAAGVGAFIATSVAQTVFGGVQDLIAGEMSWDRKTIALAATFGTWSSGLTMPFIGKMVDRFGPRWMMLLAALLVGFGSIYLAGAQTIWKFFFAYVVIRSVAGPNLQNLVPRTIAV
ncbi:MAG: MFS transporter, partial [Chloroflexota bacterium]|nr:MFS transporter [Chloroflexota bacterium]